MDDDRVLGLMVALGLFILSMCAIAIYQRRARKGADQAKADAQARLDEMVKMGLRTPEGEPTCVICRLRASEYAPVTGVSWMDKLPMLNRLYSLAPRHIIVDNIEGDLCFCRLHKQMAVSQLEKAHARLRAERAEFNAMQETRIASLDGGELIQQVMKMHRSHIRVLKMDMTTPLPALPETTRDEDDDPIMTAVVTSPSSIPDEET